MKKVSFILQNKLNGLLGQPKRSIVAHIPGTSGAGLAQAWDRFCRPSDSSDVTRTLPSCLQHLPTLGWHHS